MTIEENTSQHMAHVVRRLAIQHGLDLTKKGVCLLLGIPDRVDRLMIFHTDDGRVSVTRFLVSADSFVYDLDLVFVMQPFGWEPVEMIYDPELWEIYVQTAETAGLQVYDAQGDIRFAGFTEYIADQLECQGWLIASYVIDERPPWLKNKDRTPLGRIPGCQSTNHEQCYGVLWQCSRCHKAVCCAEGSDDRPELCDDCWVKQQVIKETDVSDATVTG